MDQQIKAALEDLSANIEEILDSAASIKGEAFALAASAHFEAAQIIEMMARLASIAEESSEQYAETLCDSALAVIGSLVQKSCRGLSEQDFNEAMNLGCTIFERRNRTVEEIKRGMQDDDK